MMKIVITESWINARAYEIDLDNLEGNKGEIIKILLKHFDYEPDNEKFQKLLYDTVRWNSTVKGVTFEQLPQSPIKTDYDIIVDDVEEFIEDSKIVKELDDEFDKAPDKEKFISNLIDEAYDEKEEE